MFKKKMFEDLDKKYNLHLYSGLMGIFMRHCHKNLESFRYNIKLDKILEIGAGSAPHYDYLKHEYTEYHILETSQFSKDFYINNDKVKFSIYDGIKIPFEDEKFDRIIISHCLEHILSPEEFIFEMLKKLKKGGVLSISLPTDPGLLFRLGRLFIRFFILKKKYNISPEKYDYMNATEHVNSIFNLINIIRYNFKGQIQESYLPFRLKSVDLNLFYNVHITK